MLNPSPSLYVYIYYIQKGIAIHFYREPLQTTIRFPEDNFNTIIIIIIMPSVTTHQIIPLAYPSEGQRPRITLLSESHSVLRKVKHFTPISLVSLSTSFRVFLGLPFFLSHCEFHITYYYLLYIFLIRHKVCHSNVYAKYTDNIVCIIAKEIKQILYLY